MMNLRLPMLFLALLTSSFSFAPFSFASGKQWASDEKGAFSQARREKKPLIIDFFGIWCPPCNELDETVFSTPKFIEKSRQFVLLKVDADATNSWKIKNRYKIGGYPTVVFTDSKGEEIYRIVGYRTAAEFLRVMDLVLAAKSSPLTQACKGKETDDLWRCAMVCSERKDLTCAEKAFHKLEKKLSPPDPKYWLARYYTLDNFTKGDLKRNGYEQLVKEAPANPLAVVWSLEYLQTFEDDKKMIPNKEIIEPVLANYDKAVADPTKEELGIPVTDMGQLKAQLLGKVGKTEEAKLAWKQAGDLLKKVSNELPPEVSRRGYTIELIECLEHSGDVEGALKLANEYRAKYPDEFTFHFQSASLLERLKRYPEALPVAQKTYDVSYGDNRIRAAILLVGLYGSLSNKAAAKTVYDDVKKAPVPDKGLEVRTHRYLKKLDETFKKLS